MQNAYSQYRPYSYSDESDETDDDYTTDSESDESDEYEAFQGFIPPTPQTNEPFVPPDPADIYRIKDIPSNELVKKAVVSDAPNTAPFDMNNVPESQYQYHPQILNPTTLNIQTRENTTTIMVASDDRDRKSFPQPTQFQLQLPRLYRNVVSIDIAQMKLLSSFLYFRDSKFNTYFDVREQGRISPTDPSQNIVRVRIREGSYNINTLIDELNKQMNTTPIFFNFPNGFDDFVRIFPTNGDLAINFNTPGDYYYDSLLDRYISTPNINYIVTRYFQSRFAGLVNYTLEQSLVAYYYPVLKEAFLDPQEILLINTDIPTLSGMTSSDIYKRVVFEFQGLNDTIILAIVQANQGELNTYRLKNTFNYSLINKYDWTYDTFNNRMTVSSSNLNTSIVRYISTTVGQYTNDVLNDISYTAAQYANLLRQRNEGAAITTDMYNYLQTALADNFAVNFGSYSLEQLADLSTIIYVQNAGDVSGVFTQYSIDYFNAKAAGQVKIPPNFGETQPPSQSFLNLTTLTTATINPAEFNMGLKNNPYDFALSNQIVTNTYVVDPSSAYINIDNLTQSTNIVVNIPATQYAVFKFRSPVRQTIQVETMSRPLFYRYPEYNSNFGGAIPYFFDNFYKYKDISAADVSNISLITIPTIFNTPTTPIYGTLTAQLLPSTRPNSIHFYTFAAPQPPITPLPDASGFLYNLHIRIDSSDTTFSAPITAFIYHDRPMFMNDVNNIRGESPINYVYSASATTDISQLDISTRVHAGDQYYIILRSNNITTPDIPYNIHLYWSSPAVTQLLVNFNGDPGQSESFAFQDPYTYLETYGDASAVNYYFARAYDPAFIRLPISDPSAGNITPDDQLFALTFPPGWSAIGYDGSGVSNDLTDYIVFNGSQHLIVDVSSTTNTLLTDPTNQYIFQYRSSYSTDATSYFYGGSTNSLLQPDTASRIPYTYGQQPNKREYKIVHYHDTHFFAPHSAETPCDISDISGGIEYIHKVYDASAANLAPSYSYINSIALGGKSVLQLGQGVCGITFVPPEGWWDITYFTFKSANFRHGSATLNPNEEIQYIGIYPLSLIKDRNIATVSLSGALAVLEFESSQHYEPGAPTATIDPVRGTYYTFKRLDISSFAYSRPDIVGDGLAGYTPYPGTLLTNESDFYTAIPFTAAGAIIPYHMLAGSLVARPDISVPVVSPTYNSATNPDGYNMIDPSGTGDIYESKYQQSLPIGTQHLNYMNLATIFKDGEAFYTYDAGLYVGDVDWGLRSIGYRSGGDYYLLAGDKQGIRAEGDAYKIIHPGLTGRGSIFANHFDFSTALLPNQDIVWWCSTNSGAYALIRDITTSPPVCSIYLFNPLVPSPTLTFDMSFSAVTVTGTAFDLSATSQRRSFYYTTSGDFMITSPLTTAATGILYYSRTAAKFTSMEFTDATNFVMDSYVHYNDIATFHILIDNSGVSPAQPGRKLVYDVSQNSGGATITVLGQQYYSTPTYNITRISPLFGQGIFSMRTDSAGTPYFLTTNYNNRYASITSRDPSLIAGIDYDARMEVNAQSLPYNISGSNTTWHIGENDTVFFQTKINPAFTFLNPWSIMGNTQINGDRKIGVYTAWQLFYPVIKITLNKRANVYNSLTNRIDINQPVTAAVVPETYRTCSFFYNNFTDLLSDVSSGAGWKWGAESNYTAADHEFNGYEFNSYIYNINVPASQPISGASDDYYYLAIRGYSPSENIQTLVRWRLPNRYDFGQIALRTIIDEISDSIINPQAYNPNYAAQLQSFNDTFNVTRVYGASALSNFAGSNITTTNFSTFHSTFVGIYNAYSTANSTISGFNAELNGRVSSNLHQYFDGIFPSAYFSRTNLGSSIPYDLLFKSSIAEELSNNIVDQEWGIGWNLGFEKKDYTDNTVYHAPTFFKILDDYIYLRINEEQGMNVLDTTGKERYEETRETRGAIQQYNAKLLLANFGNYSQTLIKNPMYFNPPIGKLDRLKFTWVDSKGQVIDNTDCDWSAAFNITERVERATIDSSLVQGSMRK